MTCAKHQVKQFKYYLYLLLYLDVNTTDINFATFILIKCSSLYSPSIFSKHKTPLMQIFTSIFFFSYICMQLLMKDNDWQKHVMYKCIKLLCIQISWDKNFQYQINSKFREFSTFLGIVLTTILWFLIHF